MNPEQSTSRGHSLASLAQELCGTPYIPTRVLGHGGTGALLEVEHKNLRRSFAMKVLRESDRPDLEDRLRVEAHALAALSHPNVLAVVDFDRTSTGRPYIVAELLQGRTLRELLNQRGRLQPHEAIDLARQALAGLAEAHRIGIVHRDVKLENLFVVDSADGRRTLKVIDFGIAKILETEPGRGHAVEPPMVPTGEDLVMGTPSFMAPEQVTNDPVDYRADIYGVGVVLYRLLTGRHPFACENALEYARAHVEETPTRPSMHVALPRGLDAIVLRAMAKLPADRFASARDMMDALEPLLTLPSAPRKTEHSSNNLIAHALVKPSTEQKLGSEDSAPTNPIRRSDLRDTVIPITNRPAFAPVAPPRRHGRAHRATERRHASEAAVAGNGTLIVSNKLLHPRIVQPTHRSTTVEACSFDDVAPLPSRESSDDCPPSIIGRAALTPSNPAGATQISKRPRMKIERRDRATWIASIAIVLIVLFVAAYAAWLIHGV